MRTFIAVDLSDEIRTQIETLQQELGSQGLQEGTLKFVDPKQAHQTIKFLGEVPDEAIERIKEALATIQHEPFEIQLRGVGFFPQAAPEKARTIRVIWVGIEEGGAQMKSLQTGVEVAMHALGFPPEQRFSAHVTLCRVKKPFRSKSELSRVLLKITELRATDLGPMRVDSLKLKKSTLTPRGPIYEDLYVKSLVG
ncbi:MAG TPA: RNA 2',3'-cyclic phosphodiesterase [Methanomicrobia archaeon]|nr:RNA 2',3'-cyclic phosphodiesterase [Methanomicrobia archaeon]